MYVWRVSECIKPDTDVVVVSIQRYTPVSH